MTYEENSFVILFGPVIEMSKLSRKSIRHTHLES